MAQLSKDDILETVASMSVMDVVDLVKAMEKNLVFLLKQPLLLLTQ